MNEKATTRQELAQLLDDRMNRTYSTLVEKQELEPDTSLIKTYIVEAHLPEDTSESNIQNGLERISSIPLVGKRTAQINSTKDRTLYWLSFRFKREDVTIYIDVSNPRFWILHSMNKSTSLDWLLDRLLKESEFLDRSWMWPELLEEISLLGLFHGLGLDYDRRKFKDIDVEDGVSPIESEYLKMQLWGTKANHVFQQLKRTIPSATTLSKVKVKYWLSHEPDEKFSIDDIKFDGKITARGTSFQSHLSLVTNIHRNYSEAIKHIEKNYSMNWEETNNGIRFTGGMIAFIFPDLIPDLDRFCEYLFSSSYPFRLWGVPTEINNEFYRVSSVDLHVGSLIDFEISPEFIRIYLPSGACGNTIARLYTNLTHHYDSRIKAIDGNEQPIFELQSLST